MLRPSAHLGRHGATQPGAAAPRLLQGVLLADLVLLLHALLPPLALPGACRDLLLLLLLGRERGPSFPGLPRPLLPDPRCGAMSPAFVVASAMSNLRLAEEVRTAFVALDPLMQSKSRVRLLRSAVHGRK